MYLKQYAISENTMKYFSVNWIYSDVKISIMIFKRLKLLRVDGIKVCSQCAFTSSDIFQE